MPAAPFASRTIPARKIAHLQTLVLCFVPLGLRSIRTALSMLPHVTSFFGVFCVGFIVVLATMLPVSAAPSNTKQPVPAPIVLAKAQGMSGQATVTNAPFALTAVLDQTAQEGQPMILILALSSTESFITSSAAEASSFQITITDNTGLNVKRTSFGDWILTTPTFVYSNVRSTIEPGQILQYRYNLARLFDLSRPGDYVVHVEKNTLVLPPLNVHLEENAADVNGRIP